MSPKLPFVAILVVITLAVADAFLPWIPTDARTRGHSRPFAAHSLPDSQTTTTTTTPRETKSKTDDMAKLQQDLADLQQQLRQDLLQENHDEATVTRDAQALLEMQLELTAAEIEALQQQATAAHEEMEDAIRQVRNAFILKQQANAETKYAIDEATWLENSMDTDESDLKALLLAHAAHDVKVTDDLWQQAQVKRLEALTKEVRAKDHLWALMQKEESLKSVQASNDEKELYEWAKREVPKHETLVDVVKRKLAARDEIV